MMQNDDLKTESMPAVTEKDIEVAAILYPLLVEQARLGDLMTYGDLLAKAQRMFPDDETIQKAIPIGLGRRLEVVRMFTSGQGYPDVTSLVVNSGTGEVGSAFGFDPVERRRQVSSFDWSEVNEEFGLFLTDRKSDLAKKATKAVSEEDAKISLWSYYKANKAGLPDDIAAARPIILALIMRGIPAAEAFEQAS